MAAEDELNIKGQEPTVNVDGITDPEYELDDPEEVFYFCLNKIDSYC